MKILPKRYSIMDLYEFIPDSLCKKLHGLTINEAIEKELINDLGDENGNFIFHSEHDPNLLLAIVQHYKIKCSEPLTQQYSAEEIHDMVGHLSFFRYSDGNTYECRLCRPHGIKLGKPLLTLKKSDFIEDDGNSEPLQIPLFDYPPQNPSRGAMYFDTRIKKLRYYDGDDWKDC